MPPGALTAPTRPRAPREHIESLPWTGQPASGRPKVEEHPPSTTLGKIHRLREAALWEDPPEYFDPKKGLLAYAPRVRRELIRRAGVMDVASHFALVHDQLVQVRAAFLLAERLGRLLVLPRLVCGLDRFWAPHNGTIPGSDTTLPSP